MMGFFNSVKSLRNKENGSRAFVLANGPSVLDFDLRKCKDDVVIGMNASSLLQEKSNIKLDYYCVSDRRFLLHPEKRKFSEDLIFDSTVSVYREELKDLVVKNKNTYFVKSLGRDGFSFGLHHGFFFGATTTMLAIQLATYLGCREIYLLGVDLKYSNDNPRFYKEETPQIEDSSISVQIHNFINARKALSSQDVLLYTCSEKSFIRPYIQYKQFDRIFER